MKGEDRLDHAMECYQELKRLDHSKAFRAAWSFCPVASIIALQDGTIERVNNEAAALLGYAPRNLAHKEEIKALGWGGLTHPDDLFVDLAIATDKAVTVYKLRKRYRLRDGSYLWVKMEVQKFTDLGEQVVGMVWIRPCENQDYECAEVLCTSANGRYDDV